MASAYFTFPALVVIYLAQRAGELRATVGRPRFVSLPKFRGSGALQPAVSPA